MFIIIRKMRRVVYSPFSIYIKLGIWYNVKKNAGEKLCLEK